MDFNFLQQQMKEPPKEVYEFHARPAPKTTAPGAIPVSRRSVMPKVEVPKKPPTPTFRRVYQADTVPAVCDVSLFFIIILFCSFLSRNTRLIVL